MDILKKENIILNQPKAERTEIIKRTGKLLSDSGYSTEKYTEGMLKRDESFSTAIGNFIAIPHGAEEYKKEILNTGLVILSYPEGVEWGDKVVHLVIGIAAKGDEHLDIMGNVVDNLETGEDTLKLVKEGNADKVYELFKGTGAP
jgi:mannitol/fructose-specific phosphotransferase system IIA component